ncbi:MAG: aspartate carbamoyltransferase [Verrucomicrobiota bacterium]|nr:aspartate carbamoyltransferase [Verrucomicrobiota bacterium]
MADANDKHLWAVSWDDFQALSVDERASYFMEGEREVHVILAQQFARNRLDALNSLATQVRFIAKSRAGMRFLRDLLSHKRAMLYFTQPSTRTFLSFSAACQILGMTTSSVRDSATSSEFKGESQEDSVRTFSSYFDVIIMRSAEKGLAERMAWVLSNSERAVPIVNAGSGKDQHPTQALLDIYTLQRSFERLGGIDGKHVAFVGDLARGRTVRSLASLLALYDGVKQTFVAPSPLQIGRDVLDFLTKAKVAFELTEDFERVIPKADAIYMTRVQDEWDKTKGESGLYDIRKFWFTAQRLSLLRPDAILMHPLPRRDEIEAAVDRDPRAMYWRQMRNGMWVRAALIAGIFHRDKEIQDYHEQNL